MWIRCSVMIATRLNDSHARVAALTPEHVRTWIAKLTWTRSPCVHVTGRRGEFEGLVLAQRAPQKWLSYGCAKTPATCNPGDWFKGPLTKKAVL